MKQLLLALSVVAVSSAASAGNCFNFKDGTGPSQVVNHRFAAPATKVCFSRDRDGANVTFSDSEGVLAQFSAVEQSTGRCGNAFCKTLSLSYGNVNGENVDGRGATISVTAEPFTDGTFTLQSSRDFPQKYSVEFSR